MLIVGRYMLMHIGTLGGEDGHPSRTTSLTFFSATETKNLFATYQIL